jgi:pyruvate/2-oxoglutarate dehydrogenase complex dihydrolipoamide acyltransferase (E2) component
MPQMGVSVAEGTVVEWKKAVGDTVERDEIICSISTDKIDTDVESPAAGVVKEILVEVDETVDVGTVMARISTNGNTGNGGGQTPAAEEASEEPVKEDVVSKPSTRDRSSTNGAEAAESHRYSPVVARIAAEHGVDLREIKGTGRGGRVRKQDVLAVVSGGKNGAQAAPESAEEPPLHIESPYRPEPTPESTSAKPAPAGVEISSLEPRILEQGPLSRMRRSIGRHMLESLQTTATCTTVIEADMSRIEIARKRHGLTYLPFIAHCTVETLREYPALNATLEDDKFTTYEDVNLGIAVSLGEEGLIVPVIHHAQNYSADGMGEKIKDLAQHARDHKLSPDDVQGGTFTITNPGSFGSIIATPVINQPQVAILDTEAVVKRPVVITDELGRDSIAIRPMTYLCLSWDHRALDGALAAQFLAALRKRLESWPLD